MGIGAGRKGRLDHARIIDGDREQLNIHTRHGAAGLLGPKWRVLLDQDVREAERNIPHSIITITIGKTIFPQKGDDKRRLYETQGQSVQDAWRHVTAADPNRVRHVEWMH